MDPIPIILIVALLVIVVIYYRKCHKAGYEVSAKPYRETCDE